MGNDHLVAVNIPADGLFLAIQEKANGDLSRENCTRLIRAYMDRILDTKPDIIFLNVNYRRALTPSDVMDSYLYDITPEGKTLSPTTESVSKYFSVFFTCARPLLENGIDIYEILTRHIRASGCKVYLSVRMNDGHYRNDPAINTPFAQKYSVAGDGADLDFTQSAVQDRYCAYIDELIRRYDPDGIELDWLRYPTCLPQEKRGDYTIINNYMGRIRAQLPATMALAVRLYPSEEKNLAHGFDVAQWIADGTADLFTMENFYVPTNFEMPVGNWREKIAKRNTENRPYTLLCGSDWAVACRPGYHIPMNPPLVRGFVGEALSRGADGVYLFNFFEEDAFSSWMLTPDGRLETCFAERLQAAREPEKLPRRCVHIGATGRRYPIVLESGGSYEYDYDVKKPCGTICFTVGADAPVSLEVGGQTIPLQDAPVIPGFGYGGAVRGGEFVYTVTELAPVVKTAVLPTAEHLHIVLKNTSDQTANILWLELSFEP